MASHRVAVLLISGEVGCTLVRSIPDGPDPWMEDGGATTVKTITKPEHVRRRRMEAGHGGNYNSLGGGDGDSKGHT